MTDHSFPWRADPDPLDRVVALVPEANGRAIVNVPATLSILEQHFPRFPVLPGVILLASMTALACRVLGGDAWRLRAATAVRFRHYVRPGDSLLIEVCVVDFTPVEAVLRARAELDGRIAANARTLTMARPGNDGGAR